MWLVVPLLLAASWLLDSFLSFTVQKWTKCLKQSHTQLVQEKDFYDNPKPNIPNICEKGIKELRECSVFQCDKAENYYFACC